MRRRVTPFSGKRPGRGARRGLTLAEVLVSLMILAGAMVPILKALTQAHHGSTLLEQRSVSWMLAQSQMEALRARSLGDWGSSWGRASQSLGDGFYCTITDSGPLGDLRTVRVQTGYDADGDRTLDASEMAADLSSLIARRD